MDLEKHKDYLSGKKFSNALRIELTPKNDMPISRLEVISILVKGKRVVHAGCFDHSEELIKAKLAKNRWLHKIISENAAHCLGVDIDQNGIAFMRDQLGYRDVLPGDLMSEKVSSEINKNKWDYLVLGEILEHIDDPVSFLKQIRLLYKDRVDKLIITVPNAFAINNFINAFKNTEVINSDHRYWFTPYTLTKILISAEMRLDKIYFCQYFNPPKLGLKHKLTHPLSSLTSGTRQLFLKFKPVMRDDLVAVLDIGS